MSDALYRLTDVTKNYALPNHVVRVLSDLNLTIAEGEFMALMGPSGSGKSTLLNMLGGLDKPTRGAIEFKGQRLDWLNQAQTSKWRSRHVGFVFQSYNLMPMLNAAQNVELPLLLTRLGRAERRRRVATAIDLVGLGDRARHRPRELSGGQQQRVALARAIVSDPDLILADEPTGDLDRDNATEIMQLFSSLNTQLGKTIIMVTHDPEAAGYARRIVRLNKGEISESETGGREIAGREPGEGGPGA